MSRRSRNRQSGSSMELDSFLDIVANLVGILIILVVVVGLQMGEKIASAPSEEVSKSERQLEAMKSTENQLFDQLAKRRSDHELLAESARREEALVRDLKKQRGILLRRIGLAKALLEENENKLSESQKVKLASFQKVTENDRLIQQLGAQVSYLENQKPKKKPSKKVIQHYPTPIAKTAFGREVHFQLKNNKIVHAPLEELIRKLRATWETHASDIRIGNTLTETIGPVGDFRLQYSLEAKKQKARTAAGVVFRRVVNVTRFTLLPVRADLGVPVDVALKPGSRLDKILRSYPSKNTTVSVWVYPDSYQQFLDLRKDLIRRGYRVAVWPLEHHQNINGGPDGFRTSAQ